ncbi:MAG: hypothetical protein Kow0056_02840 [Coriobacteriia bacterium]
MHPKDMRRLIASAAALLAVSAAAAVLIVLTGADLQTVGTFTAFLVLGWLVADAASRLLTRRLRKTEPAEILDDTDDMSVSQPAASTQPAVSSVSSEKTHQTHPGAGPARDLERHDPSHVLRALCEALGQDLRCVACAMWLEDPPTGTFRLVCGEGPGPLDVNPLDAKDTSVTRAFNAAPGLEVTPLALVTGPDTRRELYRVFVPLRIDDIRGLVTIDTEGEPPRATIDDALGPWLPPLHAALALHVAHLKSHALAALFRATGELARAMDPEDVLDLGLELALDVTGADSASIMLQDDDGLLRIARHRGLPSTARSAAIKPGEGIAGWVFATSKPLLVEDLPSSEAPRRHVRSAASVPVGDEDGCIGVLNVGSREFPARFTDDHLEMLTMLGSRLCTAYRNAEAVESLEDLYLDTMKTLAVAMETKDPCSHGSVERVFDTVSAICDELGLDEERSRPVKLAALFHDMGMSALADEIEKSDRPLTTIERGILKMHPRVGAGILEDAPALREAAPMVLHHHERYDGKGYGEGLKGDSIPLGARILAVADAFVAMTSPRPYREPLTTSQAINELREHSGTQFDPEVVSAFLRTLGENRTGERATPSGPSRP